MHVLPTAPLGSSVYRMAAPLTSGEEGAADSVGGASDGRMERFAA